MQSQYCAEAGDDEGREGEEVFHGKLAAQSLGSRYSIGKAPKNTSVAAIADGSRAKVFTVNERTWTCWI